MQACNNTQMQHVKHATICKDGLKSKWEDLGQFQNSGQSAMEMIGKCASILMGLSPKHGRGNFQGHLKDEKHGH